jgi:hypothetical protein
MLRFRVCCIVLTLFITPLMAQAQHKPLPETFVSDDERLTLRYPAGWVIQTDSTETVIVGTSDLIFDFVGEVLPSGEAVLSILPPPLLGELRDIFPSAKDPRSILELIIESSLGTEVIGMTIGTPEAISFAGYQAARVDGDASGNPIFLLIVDFEDQGYFLFTGLTAPGEFAKFEPKLLAIAESVRYIPASN